MYNSSICHEDRGKTALHPLQLLASLNQTVDAADVAGPPSHRAKEAGRLGSDV